MSGVEFLKGHGTQNDFVLLPDPDVRLDLTPARVAALCDRRRGLGADGVLRVATAGALLAAGVLDALPPAVGAGDWFMDYRNADGSVAEMCGNGVRVFAHYLAVAGSAPGPGFVVGSRAGARPVVVHAAGRRCGDVTVDMGAVRELGTSSATLGGYACTGLGVDVGNPHLACVDPTLTADGLAALDFSAAPEYDRGVFPDGVNLEILTPMSPGEGAIPGERGDGGMIPGERGDGGTIRGAVHMRVFERGIGETRSCGTGTVAAAAAALRAAGHTDGEVVVLVPGGAVTVAVSGGAATLRGPSELVAAGRLDPDWWAAPDGGRPPDAG